jgi:hypothetical protein
MMDPMPLTYLLSLQQIWYFQLMIINEPPVFHTRAAFQRALGSMFLPIENDPREIRLELSCVEWQIYEIKICTTTDRLPIYWYMWARLVSVSDLLNFFKKKNHHRSKKNRILDYPLMYPVNKK